MTFGLDYAGGKHPTNTQMRASKVEFVVRYLSGGRYADKDLTLDEAKHLEVSKIRVCVVFETTAGRALEGFAAGKTDAKAAMKLATSKGMPKGRPIYFAVDRDVSGTEVDAYFHGLASAMPLAQIGVYGSYRVVNFLQMRNRVRWIWQTYAWSGGKWYGGGHLQQYKNEVMFHGCDVDYDRATQKDYGQWSPSGWKPKFPPVVPPGSPLLIKDSGGLDVYRLQQCLNFLTKGQPTLHALAEDGEMGTLTVDRLKWVQAHVLKFTGRAVDGQFGTVTSGKMREFVK